MRYLIFLILTSCGIDEVTPPIPKVECPHTISIEQGEREDKITICIVSDLPEVWVTVQDYPRTKVRQKFYGCRSWHISKDECYIKIEAEGICEYIY